jgi:MFS family permease
VAKRRLILVTQSIMLVQAFTLALLTSTGLIRVPHLYVLAAILGIANAIDNPTRQAFVAELVGEEDLPNAVALNSAQFNASRLIGPGLGGLTIALVGIAGCFYLNAASYLAVLGGLILMRPLQVGSGRPPRRSNIFSEIGAGLRYAFSVPDITLVILLMAFLGTFGYNFTVVLPLVARFVLHAGPVGFGGLTSVMAIGSLGAALGIAYRGRASRRTLFQGGAAFSLLLLGVALSRSWALTLPLVVLLGFASITFTATANTRLQRIVEPAYRGRVMSLYTLLFAGTTPFGAMIVGTLADRVGVQGAVAIMAGLCIVGIAVGLLFLQRTHRALLPDVPTVPPGVQRAPSAGVLGE